MNLKRPMKGVDCLEHLDEIRYPKLVQPKYDGIRIIFYNGTALSASMKPLRNEYLQKLARTIYSDLDVEGEFFVPPTLGGLRKAASICNSFDSTLEAGNIILFDLIDFSLPYSSRLKLLIDKCERLANIAPTELVADKESLEEKLSWHLNQGFEGVMIKDELALYKQGRSTLHSQECLKLKPFSDAEAEVIGWDYEYENTNPTETNELGLTSRSSSKLGKLKKPLVGSLLAKSPLFPQTFSVAGFTMEDKERMYAERDSLIGRVFTFKYQPSIVYSDAPRHPIFRRWRPTYE